MRYSICVIDDSIKYAATSNDLEDTKLINSVSLKHLLKKKEDWTETSLYNLCEKLVTETNNEGVPIWANVYAFTHPEFYLNSFEEDLFRCDIIVFDWDYTDSPIVDHEALLFEILNKSHAIIHIYTSVEQIDEIKKIITGEKLNKYFENKRLNILQKDSQDSQEQTSHLTLITNIKKLYDENFSFMFGNQLRNITNIALDKILLKLSELHIGETLKFLGSGNQEQVDYDVKQMIGEKIKDNLREDSTLIAFLKSKGITTDICDRLIGLISEKVKVDLLSKKINYPHTATEFTNKEILPIAKELWSYRLYHSPSDDLVRKGDIIRIKNGANYNELYFVITPDCDLTHFWSKTLGYLNIVPMVITAENKDTTGAMVKLIKKAESYNSIKAISTFSNPINNIGGGLLYFPYINIENDLKNFICFPRQISSYHIPMPDGIKNIQEIKKRDKALMYSYFPEYERVTTLSEPFVTPTIESILSTIAGYATPDYPTEIQTDLAENFKTIYT